MEDEGPAFPGQSQTCRVVCETPRREKNTGRAIAGPDHAPVLFEGDGEVCDHVQIGSLADGMPWDQVGQRQHDICACKKGTIHQAYASQFHVSPKLIQLLACQYMGPVKAKAHSKPIEENLFARISVHFGTSRLKMAEPSNQHRHLERN
jgi:hypothetical protein